MNESSYEAESACALVNAVKQHRLLYDSNEPDYHVKHKQDQAWLEVANAVKAPVGCCKEKWKNLRAAFSRHMRNVIAHKAGGRPKKPYYMAHHMEFLIPHTKHHSTNHSCTFKLCRKDEPQAPENETSTFDIKIEKLFIPEASYDYEDETLQSPLNETEGSTGSFDYWDNSNSKPTIKEPKAEPKDNETPKEQTPTKRKREETPPRIENTLGANHFDKEEHDADLNFLKSLLPNMRLLQRGPKNKFKISVLTSLEDILNEQSK